VSAVAAVACHTIQICDNEEEEPQHPLLGTVKEYPLAMVEVAMVVLPPPATVVVDIQHLHLAIMVVDMEEEEGRDLGMVDTVVKVKILVLLFQWIR
jgi:hypothetical protein